MNLTEVGVYICFCKLGPDLAGRRRWPVTLHAEQETGFLGGFAERSQSKSAREVSSRLRDPLQQLFLGIRMQLADRRHQAVECLDAPTGKDKFARHEFVPGMTAAKQHFRSMCGPIDQHKRGSVARLAVRKGHVALRHSHALGPKFSEVLRHRAFRRLPRWRYSCCRSSRRGRGNGRLRRPSDKISKRRAPATGAASTSFTVTGSPRR